MASNDYNCEQHTTTKDNYNNKLINIIKDVYPQGVAFLIIENMHVEKSFWNDRNYKECVHLEIIQQLVPKDANISHKKLLSDLVNTYSNEKKTPVHNTLNDVSNDYVSNNEINKVIDTEMNKLFNCIEELASTKNTFIIQNIKLAMMQHHRYVSELSIKILGVEFYRLMILSIILQNIKFKYKKELIDNKIEFLTNYMIKLKN